MQVNDPMGGRRGPYWRRQLGLTLPGERTGAELAAINALRLQAGLPPLGGPRQVVHPVVHALLQRAPRSASAVPMPSSRPGPGLLGPPVGAGPLVPIGGTPGFTGHPFDTVIHPFTGPLPTNAADLRARIAASRAAPHVQIGAMLAQAMARRRTAVARQAIPY